MELLRETGRPVPESASTSDSTASGTFTRTFREIVGEPPSAYRARFAGDGAALRVPACWAMAWLRRRVREQIRSSGRRRGFNVAPMLKRISHTFIHVLDQDEAARLLRRQARMVVHTDADLGVMRFLTVNFPDQPDVELRPDGPGPPRLRRCHRHGDVRELVAKGAAGGGVILETDDCRGTYESLRAKGVEFTQEPTERFYGADCALRDPFGNPIRFTQHRRTNRRAIAGELQRNPDDGYIASPRHRAVGREGAGRCRSARLRSRCPPRRACQACRKASRSVLIVSAWWSACRAESFVCLERPVLHELRGECPESA